MTEAETAAFDRWRAQRPRGPELLTISNGGFDEALREAWDAGNQYGRESAREGASAVEPDTVFFGPM